MTLPKPSASAPNPRICPLCGEMHTQGGGIITSPEAYRYEMNRCLDIQEQRKYDREVAQWKELRERLDAIERKVGIP